MAHSDSGRRRLIAGPHGLSPKMMLDGAELKAQLASCTFKVYIVAWNTSHLAVHLWFPLSSTLFLYQPKGQCQFIPWLYAARLSLFFALPWTKFCRHFLFFFLRLVSVFFFLIKASLCSRNCTLKIRWPHIFLSNQSEASPLSWLSAGCMSHPTTQ